MTDVGLESQHLKEHVKNTNDDSGAEKIRVSIKQNFLNHLKLAAISSTRAGDALSSISGSLLGTLIDTGNNAKFPVGEVVEVDMKRKLVDGRIQGSHMSSKLPKCVHK